MPAEFATVYLNECSQIAYSSVLIALTRLAQNIGLVQKCFFDLNPTGKGHWSNLLFGEKRDPRTRQPVANPEQYASLNSIDNSHN
jgi:hypothetical protein